MAGLLLSFIFGTEALGAIGFEQKISNLNQNLISKVLPLVATCGLIYGGFLMATGNAEGRGKGHGGNWRLYYRFVGPLNHAVFGRGILRMELKVSRVHRNLEAKMKIAGMEACDLLFVLIFASLMDLTLGHTSLRVWFVFLLPASLGIVLFFTKRGRPGNYLLHLIRYHCTPGRYSAGTEPQDERQRQKEDY